MNNPRLEIGKNLTLEQKQQKLEKIKKHFEKVADKLGKPIDRGIFETVVILNTFGFNTRMSCEGHLKRAYYIGPWVDIEIKEIPTVKKLKDKISQLMQQANQLKAKNENRKKINTLLAKRNAYSLLILKRNLKIMRQLAALLDEFYQNRKVGFDVRLILDISLQGWTRFLSQGAMLQDGLQIEEKRENLRKYQQEMKDFTEFLKTKYSS